MKIAKNAKNYFRSQRAAAKFTKEFIVKRKRVIPMTRYISVKTRVRGRWAIISLLFALFHVPILDVRTVFNMTDEGESVYFAIKSIRLEISCLNASQKYLIVSKK